MLNFDNSLKQMLADCEIHRLKKNKHSVQEYAAEFQLLVQHVGWNA